MGARGSSVKENGVPGQQVAGLSEMGVPIMLRVKGGALEVGWPVSLRWGLEVGAEGLGPCDTCCPSGAHTVRE